MTVYDEPSIKERTGRSHPLAGVSQHVLDAARDTLSEALRYEIRNLDLYLDEETVESIAHSVLVGALEARGSRVAGYVNIDSNDQYGWHCDLCGTETQHMAARVLFTAWWQARKALGDHLQNMHIRFKDNRS